MNDLTVFDQPEILQIIFYPRRDSPLQPTVPFASTHFIQVEEDISISCRFYSHNKEWPNILFFHGNGEIANDYDGIGPVYTQMGINFFVADYRGYGSSGGRPTISDMMKDAHPIFEGFKQILDEGGYSGKLFLMGRSLGSASAVELAHSYQGEIKGLILESGFADFLGLLSHIGIPVDALGLSEVKVLSNLDKIRLISIPTLIIHAEEDFIVPIENGRALYEGSTAKEKRLFTIPNADHNSIMLIGGDSYFKAIGEFVSLHS